MNRMLVALFLMVVLLSGCVNAKGVPPETTGWIDWLKFRGNERERDEEQEQTRHAILSAFEEQYGLVYRVYDTWCEKWQEHAHCRWNVRTEDSQARIWIIEYLYDQDVLTRENRTTVTVNEEIALVDLWTGDMQWSSQEVIQILNTFPTEGDIRNPRLRIEK